MTHTPAQRKTYQKKKYSFDSEYRASVQRKDMNRRYRIKELIANTKKDGCLLCPEKEPCCLSFHHKNSAQMTFRISEATRYGMAALLTELQKCVCLCENCHRKIHAGILSLPAE